jgi:hypothetical protein
MAAGVQPKMKILQQFCYFLTRNSGNLEGRTRKKENFNKFRGFRVFFIDESA